MNRRSTPGAGQWLTVSILVVATIFLLIKLFQFASLRDNYPTGLTIAGVDVSNMNENQAAEVLTNRFIEAPVVLYYLDERFEISPSQAQFELDLDTMLRAADAERTEQDFWAGFWGFLWGTPVEVDPIPIAASHNRTALSAVLTDISALMDIPSQPPQPVPQTYSFQYGEAGVTTNIEASFADVEAALYRASNREARLVLQPTSPQRPERNLLVRLLVNNLQDFETIHGGVATMFVLNLRNGEEIAINADMPMTGMDLVKIPIVLETYRLLDSPPTLSQNEAISNTLVTTLDNSSANQLLSFISGDEDLYAGAAQVSETMRQLGLENSFITIPYDEEPRAGSPRLETPANIAEDVRTTPDPYIQTTAEDMGTLLSMIYYCAEGIGGALTAVFPEEITQTECRTLLAFMLQNDIGSLIEEGIPPDIPVAHRHGWISDTHGDAGIAFTPGGDYVIVIMLYKPNWLEWEISSPLIANMSRATYNFFNFDDPYLADARITN